jgi:hypothetical protein
MCSVPPTARLGTVHCTDVVELVQLTPERRECRQHFELRRKGVVDHHVG